MAAPLIKCRHSRPGEPPHLERAGVLVASSGGRQSRVYVWRAALKFSQRIGGWALSPGAERRSAARKVCRCVRRGALRTRIGFCLRNRSWPRRLPHVIGYSATLDVPEETATLVTELLVGERRRCSTPVGSRAASARTRAILVLRR